MSAIVLSDFCIKKVGSPGWMYTSTRMKFQREDFGATPGPGRPRLDAMTLVEWLLLVTTREMQGIVGKPWTRLPTKVLFL